jgi:large subunit ribosomal protein L15
MKLNELNDNPGARKDRVRVGRGIGSGIGKTAGRGMKGQKSRSGVAVKGFEGGQMPLHMRLPKRGFNKPNRRDYSEVNTGALQRAIDAGRLDAKAPVDMAALQAAGLVTQPKDGVRLLGKGELKVKLDLHVAGVTRSALAAVEALGGTVTLPVQGAGAPPREGSRAAARAAARADARAADA